MSDGKKSQILFLAHRIPYPPNKGDKIRAFNTLVHLAKRHDVHLGAFIDDPEDRQHTGALEEICKTTCFIDLPPLAADKNRVGDILKGRAMSLSRFVSPRMTDYVQGVREQGLVFEYAFSGAMAHYLKGANAPAFVDFADVDSAKWSALAKTGPVWKRLVYRREAELVERAEREAINSVDRAFFVSPEEASLARSINGVDGDLIAWFRNGIDPAYWRADADFDRSKSGTDLIFTGRMDYAPNIEAVKWFADNVWSRLRASHPSLTFAIAGAKPDETVQNLQQIDGISVLGDVPDMRPHLAAAKIAIAPLKIARGVQNKLLEAMAMQVPVIASTGAATGCGANEGEHFLIADTADEWVDAVGRLLGDPAIAYEMAHRARLFISQEGGWQDRLSRLDAVLPTEKRAG